MTSLERRARILAICLSALAGYVDAVGFIETKGFFVSFMSGNSTRLGLGLAESLPDAAAAAGIITAFIGGVAGGSILGHRSGARRGAAVLGGIAIILALAVLLGSSGHPWLAGGLIAMAMGAENAVFERSGEVRFGLTYMTGSLVKVGQGLAGLVIGRNGWEWTPNLLLWAGFVAGVVLGARMHMNMDLASLWFAVGTAAGLALVAGRLLDSEPTSRRP